MAGIVKSVQQFSITLNNVTSNTATISSVNTSKSAIFWNGFITSATGNASQILPRVVLTNSTTVTAYKNTATGSITVRGVVVEFEESALNSDIQYGTVSIGSGASGTATINSVDTSKAIVLYLGCTSTSSSLVDEDDFVTVRLTSSTQVTAERATTGNSMTVGFCVVEFASSVVNSIQHFNVPFGTGTTTDQTISSVNTDKAVIIYDWFNDGDGDPFESCVGCQFTSGTNVRGYVYDADDDTDYFTFSVLEFKDDIINSIQRGTISLNGVTSNTATISSVDTSRAFVIFNGFTTSQSTGGTENTYFPSITLTNSTTITAYKASASTNATLYYEVIEFKESATGYTLTADYASYSSTFRETGGFVARKIFADYAAYTANFLGANLLKGYSILAEFCSFASSYFEASLLFGRKLIVDFSSFSMTFLQAQLLVSLKIVAETVSYGCSFIAANFAKGIGIFAETAYCSLAGFSANLLKSFKILIEYGSFVGNFVNANLSFGRKIICDTSYFSLTFNQIASYLQAKMEAVLATFSLSFISADLTKSGESTKPIYFLFRKRRR